MAKEMKKIVKALNQKVTMLTIPKAFCTLLDINPGDKLEITLKVKDEVIEVRKL